MGVVKATYLMNGRGQDHPKEELREINMSSLASRRVGSSLVVLGHKLYRWRGDTAFTSRSDPENTIEMFDFATGKWSSEKTSPETKVDVVDCEVDWFDTNSDIPVAVTGSSMVSMGDNTLYLFGGFGTIEREKYYRGLYRLDLNAYKWKRIVPINDAEGPMAKYLAGMVTLDETRGLILIFGGFGVLGMGHNRQKGADYCWSQEFRAVWTNELHIYDISESVWRGVETTGTKPPPCAAASFTRIDRDRIVLFGGRQQNERVNQLHILDTSCWQWSGPRLQSSPQEPWPSPRSLHTAVCLLDPLHVQLPSLDSDMDTVMGPSFTKQRLLVIWGQDTSGDQITESWILDTDTMTWSLNENIVQCKGRKWHSSAVYHPTPYESIIVTTGGFNKDEMMFLINPSQPDPDNFYVKTGVCSLYQLCLQCANSVEGLSTWLLPKHIQRHLHETRTFSDNYKSLKLTDHSSKFCVA